MSSRCNKKTAEKFDGDVEKKFTISNVDLFVQTDVKQIDCIGNTTIEAKASPTSHLSKRLSATTQVIFLLCIEQS